MKVLITTTSFQDTPGPHHDLLAKQGWDLTRQRGPLPEDTMLKLVGDFEGIICGDDAFTKPVLAKCLPALKCLSKYGIGLDKIDLDAATELKIPVCNTPGVNHTTVAEHTIGLLLAMVRNIPTENGFVHQAQWKRITGHELAGQTLGVLGLGRIGKEVAKRAMAFGMKVLAYDIFWNEANDKFLADLNAQLSHEVFAEFPPAIEHAPSADVVLAACDFLALHMNLTDDNREFLNADRLAAMKDGVYVVNPSRGGLISEADMAAACKSGKVAGYAADVVEPEPIRKDNPLIGLENVVLTPHIGSRTYESVVRQATMAVQNLAAMLSGKPPLHQANKF